MKLLVRRKEGGKLVMLLQQFHSHNFIVLLCWFLSHNFRVVFFFSSCKKELDISEKKMMVDYCYLSGHHSIRTCRLREHSDCCDINM